MSFRRIRRHRGGGILRVKIPVESDDIKINREKDNWIRQTNWIIKTSGVAGTTGLRFYCDFNQSQAINELQENYYNSMKQLYVTLGWDQDVSGNFNYLHYYVFRDRQLNRTCCCVCFFGNLTGSQIYNSSPPELNGLYYLESSAHTFTNGGIHHCVDVYPIRYVTQNSSVHMKGYYIRNYNHISCDVDNVSKSVWYKDYYGPGDNHNTVELIVNGYQDYYRALYFSPQGSADELQFILHDRNFHYITENTNIDSVTEANPAQLFSFTWSDYWW